MKRMTLAGLFGKTAAAERICPCCDGAGEHSSGFECYTCDGGGSLYPNEDDTPCDGRYNDGGPSHSFGPLGPEGIMCVYPHPSGRRTAGEYGTEPSMKFQGVKSWTQARQYGAEDRMSTQLPEHPIASAEEAQKIADKVTKHAKVRPVTVSHRPGMDYSFAQAHPEGGTPRIVLGDGGMNHSTLLHELAHHIDREKGTQDPEEPHDDSFRGHFEQALVDHHPNSYVAREAFRDKFQMTDEIMRNGGRGRYSESNPEMNEREKAQPPVPPHKPMWEHDPEILAKARNAVEYRSEPHTYRKYMHDYPELDYESDDDYERGDAHMADEDLEKGLRPRLVPPHMLEAWVKHHPNPKALEDPEYDDEGEEVPVRKQAADDGTVRMVEPEEYRKFHYPDYPQVKGGLGGLVRHFKKTDPDYFAKVRDDVQQNGFTTPILVRYKDPRGNALKKPHVMEGHHRAAVAHDLGLPLPVGDYDNETDFQRSRQGNAAWFQKSERSSQGVSWGTEAALQPRQAAEDPDDPGPEDYARREGEDGFDHDERIVHGLSVGHLTLDQAKGHGYHPGGREDNRDSWTGEPNGNGWQPLPQELYHTTTDAAGVMAHGLKSAQELGHRNGHGLGGTPQWLSMTYSADHAHNMLDALHEYHAHLNGKTSFADLHRAAQNGEGAQQPYHEHLTDGLSDMFSDEHRAAALRGKRIEPGLAGYREAKERGWTPHPTLHRNFGTDSSGEEIGTGWERPPSLEERHNEYSAFSRARDFVGKGKPSILFLSNDRKAFAAKDPSNFAVLKLRPKPGAQGFPMEGEHEWRTGTGQAVEVEGEPMRRQASRTAAEAPGPHTVDLDAMDSAHDPAYVHEHTWLPEGRYWGPNSAQNDQRLFEGDHLRPEVRQDILDRVGGVLDKYGNWRKWTRVYFAGSQAAQWLDQNGQGNGDFDILIGIDFPEFREEEPWYEELDDAEIAKLLTEDLWRHANVKDYYFELADGHRVGPFDRTFYVNPAAWDIHTLHPYAAYNVTSDEWAVHPLQVPKDWSARSLPESYWGYAESLLAEIQAIGQLPPEERHRMAANLWEEIHSHRSDAFADGGHGLFDLSNIIMKYLEAAPGNPWEQLIQWKNESPSGPEPWVPTTARRTTLTDLFEPKTAAGMEGPSMPVDRMHDVWSGDHGMTLQDMHDSYALDEDHLERVRNNWETARRQPVDFRGSPEDPQELMDGHHRYQVAVENGETHLPATYHYSSLEKTAAAGADYGGVMIAIVPPRKICEKLAQEDGEPVEAMHVTLAYMPGQDRRRAARVLPELVEGWARTQKSLTGRIGGVGTFVNPGQHVLWASVDIPGGGLFRESLVETLERHGFEVAKDHGWTPHMTLDYRDDHVRFLPKIEPVSWEIDQVYVCIGDNWTAVPLG